MKYKICDDIGVLISKGAESVEKGLEIEIDAEEAAVVTRFDGRQYVVKVNNGKFKVPSSFLIDGVYTLTVGKVKCTAFLVSGGRAMRYTESFGEEISAMWRVIAGIYDTAKQAEEAALSAEAAVEEFRDGYKTE